MILSEYINGDYTCTLYDDGTLVRRCDVENPRVAHPCSIDVKITDFCDMGCSWCHESSTVNGKHGDIERLIYELRDIPAGVELAIGGGNPLSHPGIIDLLKTLKNKGIICNITVNQGHLNTYQDMLKEMISNKLIYGLGISIGSNNFKYVKPLLELTDNIVYHVIAGVKSTDIVYKLLELGKCKILILGYKTFGFGESYYSDDVEACISEWRINLPNMIGKCSLSFDNLAIEQLEVKRLFTKEGWDRFYMGDDFQFTMYIDAVKQEYSMTSRSKDRTSFDDTTLIDYFQKDKQW